MRTNWHFKNKSSQSFRELPAFSPKSIFLVKFFEVAKDSTQYSNRTCVEWKAIRSLADGSSIIIKKADQGSCVVVRDGADYLQKTEEQLADSQVYKEAKFNENMLLQIVDAGNLCFKSLKN